LSFTPVLLVQLLPYRCGETTPQRFNEHDVSDVDEDLSVAPKDSAAF